MHHDTAIEVSIATMPRYRVLTRKKRSLGCVGPQLPHSRALFRSSGVISSRCALAVALLSFPPCAWPPYNFFHASPGASVGSLASREDTVSELLQSS